MSRFVEDTPSELALAATAFYQGLRDGLKFGDLWMQILSGSAVYQWRCTVASKPWGYEIALLDMDLLLYKGSNFERGQLEAQKIREELKYQCGQTVPF